MITNTNGLIDNIYHFLWLKDDSLLKESFKLRVPETLIYKSGCPQVWYFTNKYGEIQMKKQESKTIENIYKAFSKNIKEPGHVVGYYIYPEKFNSKQFEFNYGFQGRQFKTLDIDEKICIFYITLGMLDQFLNAQNKPPEGILQKFVEPLGIHEAIIQAIWSPSVCIMSKQQNNKDLYDMSYDPYERCTTFDGGEAFSRNIPLRGKEISQEIRKQCQMIVSKITNLSFGQTNISRMILYFKPDENNKVWFLYSSCVRIQGESQQQVKQYKSIWGNENVKKNNTPIAFTTNYVRPHQIRNTMTVNTMHPVKLFKDIECFECGDLCQQLDLYHLNYEFIIKSFEQDVNQNQMVNQNIPIIQPKNFNTQDQDHLRDIHSHIPQLILKLYPQLTVALYEQLKNNDAFLIKTVLLCEKCFLRYSESDPSISGAKQKISLKIKPVRIQSASLLQRRPDIKDYLIETNKELLEEKKKSIRIKTSDHLSIDFGSNISTHTYNTFGHSNKNKSSGQFEFKTPKAGRRIFTAK